MRAVLIFLLFIMCMHLDAQEELFFRFLKKAKTLDSFDNLKFTALNESEYNFLDGSNRVVIPLEDSIPYKEFNVFVNNSLYPVKTKKEFPIIVSKNNKGSIDSVRITDIGVLMYIPDQTDPLFRAN